MADIERYQLNDRTGVHDLSDDGDLVLFEDHLAVVIRETRLAFRCGFAAAEAPQEVLAYCGLCHCAITPADIHAFTGQGWVHADCQEMNYATRH